MKHSNIAQIGFSLIIFLMFVFGSFFMLYYGSDAYKDGLDRENARENLQIPYAYISTKIYMASNLEHIIVKDNTLIIDNDDSYTCIYYKDNGLYELVVKDASLIKSEGGNKICNLDSFSISKQDNLYLIKFNDVSFKVGKK